MATATKTPRTLQTSGPCAAGTPVNGSVWDLRTAIGGTMTGLITNGASPPTIPGDFVVQISIDNSAWKDHQRFAGGTAANGIYPFSCELPIGTLYARPSFQSNTGQSVTVESFGHELTSIA